MGSLVDYGKQSSASEQGGGNYLRTEDTVRQWKEYSEGLLNSVSTYAVQEADLGYWAGGHLISVAEVTEAV